MTGVVEINYCSSIITETTTITSSLLYFQQEMRSSYVVLALWPLFASAALNGHCTGSAATGTWKEYGICIKTSTCDSYDGAYKSGACPNDPADVKCCVIGMGDSVSVNPCGGSSYCEWTDDTCNGVFKSSESALSYK